jgi:hypothetical protein
MEATADPEGIVLKLEVNMETQTYDESTILARLEIAKRTRIEHLESHE